MGSRDSGPPGGSRGAAVAAELALKWSSSAHGPVCAVLAWPAPAQAVALVTSQDAIYILESAVSSTIKHELRAQRAGISAQAIQRPGQLITGGVDGFLKWWSVEKGEELCTTTTADGNGREITAVAVSKASSYVAAACGR
jgi:hypothetical protein